LGNASTFLQKRLADMGLEPTIQSYRFAVNTFPKVSILKAGKENLKEGYDFIIDSRSAACKGKW